MFIEQINVRRAACAVNEIGALPTQEAPWRSPIAQCRSNMMHPGERKWIEMGCDSAKDFSQWTALAYVVSRSSTCSSTAWENNSQCFRQRCRMLPSMEPDYEGRDHRFGVRRSGCSLISCETGIV